VGDHEAVRARERGEHGGLVPRLKRAQVDNFSFDAVFCQRAGGRKRNIAHGAVGHDRRIAAGARNVRLADRHIRQWLGQLALHGIEALVLDDDDGIRVSDRSARQRVGIGDRRRADYLEAGYVREPGFKALRVLRAGIDATAVRQAHDHG